MSDLNAYTTRRAKRDPEFAEGLETGYSTFKIGPLLRQARERSGLTQEEVAEGLETRKSAISRIECRAGDIRLSTLEKYAAAIGCDLSVVLRPGKGARTAHSHRPAARRAPLIHNDHSTPIRKRGAYDLTEDQLQWAKKRRQGVGPRGLRAMLVAKRGQCALSKVPMVFDRSERTPVRAGRGCHPLSPAVDHVDPGNHTGPRQIICYALNDLKGHLPTDCFEALVDTKSWDRLMKAWRAQARKDWSDREAFMRLLRPSARIK